ncbi:MAG TPA: hypothetical protein VIV08_05700 [Acidimicrobiia bacterium]
MSRRRRAPGGAPVLATTLAALAMVACGPAVEKAASGLPPGTTGPITVTTSPTPPDEAT